MSLPDLSSRIATAVATFAPGASVTKACPLLGGNSAHVTAVDLAFPDGSSKRYVARLPSDRRRGDHADVAEREFTVIRTMHAAGIPVQTPVYLEPLTPDNPAPFYLVEYCEGRPELGPRDVDDYLEQYATNLARVHRIDWRAAGLSFLGEIGLGWPEKRASGHTRMRVDEIRAATTRKPSEAAANAPVFCHGDFWPGNLLWRDGQLAAIIDWEESLIGERLYDLAIARLDLFWIVGEAGMDRFTRRYEALSGANLSNLPYWDLVAGMRPIGGIEDWAKSYPHLGRPDVTAQTMIRDHAMFVDRALRAWTDR